MKWIHWSVLFLCLFGIYGLYQDHFDNGFYFDDDHTIVNNASIRSLDNWTEFFTDPSSFSSLPKNRAYRPVTTLLNAIDYNKTGELTPASFHWTNFGAYLLLVIGIFVLAQKLLAHALTPRDAGLLALVAAIGFGYNATNSESINYIIARSDIVATMCIVWALILYLWPMGRKFHLYLIPFLVGLYTKQTGLMFIPIVILMDALFLQEKGSLITREFRALKRTWLLITVGCTAFLFNMLYMTPKTTVSHNPDVTQINYILAQLYVSFHYVKQMIWPSGLVADTDIIVEYAATGKQLAYGIAFTILMVSWLILSYIKKWRMVTFGISWFYLALAPTSLVPLFQVANDHRIQFALVGMVLAAIGQISIIIGLFQHKSSATKTIVASIIAVITFGYCLPHQHFISQRVAVWSSAESLWKDVTIKSPRNGRGFMNYGLALMEQGRLAEAEQAYLHALRILPGFEYTYINMGILQSLMGKDSQAIQYFEQAIQMQPTNPDCYFYLARYYYQRQFYAKSRSLLDKTLELSPNYSKSAELLPLVYQKMEEVRKEWSYRIELQISKIQQNPSVDNWINLSLMHYKAGDFDQCINACNEALKIEPNNAYAWNNICSANNYLRNWDAAILACEKALAVNADFAQAKGNLAEAHLGKGSTVKSLP